MTIQIIDTTGKLVRQKHYNGDELDFEISVEDLDNGIYLIVGTNSERRLLLKDKLIISHN